MDQTTISNRATNNLYQSCEELLQDVEEASSRVQALINSQYADQDPMQWKYQPESLEPSRLGAQVKAFKRMLRNLMMQESDRGLIQSLRLKDEESLAEASASSISTLEDDVGAVAGKAVLTLFGNAQGQHKQLFSSFQKPLPRHVWTNGPSTDATLQTPPEALMPVRENGLPGNQIVSSRLVAVESNDAVPTTKQNLKFRDIFHAPSSLPKLSPPKPTPSTTLRNATITWTDNREDFDHARKNDYTTEKLPTGHWLGYDGISTEEEPVTAEIKRKRRDRALSSGEANAEPLERTRAALAWAKEDALFRRVYSSFAPSVDNSAALVPEETKNDIWWNRVGQPWLEQPPAVDPALEEMSVNPDQANEQIQANEEEDYTDVVENYEPPTMDATVDESEKGEGLQPTLLRISELLESLQSYQRVRNSRLTPATRASATNNSEGLVAPASETEQEIYNQLRTELTRVAGKLPPYVLAKTDGTPLSTLVISKALLLESKDYQGTMDDDQATRLSAAAALNTSIGAASSTRTSSTVRPGSFSHSRAASGHLSSGNQVQSARTPSAMNKPPLSNWQSPSQSYSPSLPRAPYNQPTGYNRTPLNQYTAGRPIATPANGIAGAYSHSPGQPLHQQRTQNISAPWTGYASSANAHRNSSSGQAGYPPTIQRPSSSTYAAPSAGATQTTAADARATPLGPMSGTTQSPLQRGSPYAPPQAPMVSSASSTSRPETPVTTVSAHQAQIHQPGPALAPTQSQYTAT